MGTLLALGLSSPMVLLAAIPFNQALALSLAVLVPAALWLLAFATAPVIELSQTELKIGRMTLPIEVLGEATAFEGEAAQMQRGPLLSPGSQRLFRGDIGPVVKIEIVDETDPTDYVLFSSRKAQQLVSALGADRT